MFNYYKMNRWMKLFTILSGISGLYYSFRVIYRKQFTYDNVFTLFDQILSWNVFFRYVVGMFIASLMLLVVFKPNDPLPWNWFLLLVFSTLLIFICHFWVGLGGIIAGGIGLFNYL